MPDPLHIPSLTIGTRVEDDFLLHKVDSRTLDSGDPYAILTVGNASGTIDTAPFWKERQGEVAGLQRGHVVHVIGDVASYRDRRQLQVSSIRHLPKDSVDVRALLPSVGAVDRYWEALDKMRRAITKPRLRAVVDLFYEEDTFRQRYEQCPAAVAGHHAAIGGLLKHTTEVTAIARTIAKACGADQELVIAGALLHDIGKLESYRWDGLFEFTDEGRIVDHVVLGALMLDRRLGAETEPPCTPLERDILLHLVLSHHGKREFGSPVTPMTLEAEVLHWADNASAKTASMADVLRDDSNFPEGLVSKTQWTLDHRRAFRGESDWGSSE
jgi:3'-5' exoribonuclease